MFNRESSLGGALESFWLLVSLLGVAIVPAQAQNAPSPATTIKLGIVSFLTGPAAAPFGIPGRNGAEVVIEAMNAGKVPAPFDKVGFGGSNVEAKYVDETGSVANVVTEFRNLVQRDQVDAVIGYVSSGNCLAVTPVAEELKAITVFYDCGTPRILEERSALRRAPWTSSQSTSSRMSLPPNDSAGRKSLTSLAIAASTRIDAWGHVTLGGISPASTQWLVLKVTVHKSFFPTPSAGEYQVEHSTLADVGARRRRSTSFNDG